MIIQIPSNWTSNNTQSLDIQRNLIVVGANWSWKTRFWSKIELINSKTKRISAQRYLQLNEVVQKQDYQSALDAVRQSYRNRPVVEPQTDYQQLLMWLFAEEAERNHNYVELMKSSADKQEIPLSIKERLISIWSFIFPNRELILESDRVRAKNNSSIFSGTEMSDWEKVALYLISQVLLIENNWILIIDEPELHLHKALMVRLWNKLEEERKDCTFIYITHDLDFAVGKNGSSMIWIKSYQNNVWDWELLEPNWIIPENLFLEVLWSRKPILFVEWDKWSLDLQIYQTIYPNFTVIPCSSCDKVIESVKWLSTHPSLHDKKIFWIIDKDFRPNEQLKSLESSNIFHTKVNEIENIFLAPENLQLICDYLNKTDKISEISDKIKRIYSDKKDNIQFRASKSFIYRKLNETLWGVSSLTEYEVWKSNIITSLDVCISWIILPESIDIVKILEYYPHKWLINEIQWLLELSWNGYQNLVLSFFSSDKSEIVIANFQKYLPTLPTE